MRIAMGTRRQTARLLTTLLFVGVPSVLSAGPIVIAQNGRCGDTVFDVSLLSTVQQPSRLRLDVVQRSTKAKTTLTADVDAEGRYHTAPARLPFTDYDIDVYSATLPQVLLGHYSLGTVELARIMVPGADKRPLHVRGDYTVPDHGGALQRFMVAVNPPRAASAIHIVVVDENWDVAAQYLGPPVRHWSTEVPPGQYAVWLTAYDATHCVWVKQ